MTVYLPIAELSVNVFIILGMGAAVGFLSGMFGVGGGFLITPLLIFYNIPPVVAVATGANQVVASSVSGSITHFRRGTLDVKLGSMLLIGGLCGATVGVWLFTLLRSIGQLDLIISLLYVILLSTVGGLMLKESISAIRRTARNETIPLRRPGHHNWVHRLPLKMRFKKSKLYLSVIPIIALGFAIGILTSVMGVGGGFIMVPAMIYLLRIPTNVVVGTSLFQIIFVTAYTTIVQAATNYSVDIVLAFILMLAGVIGAQYGVRVGQKLRGEQLRALLALLVLAVGIRLAIGLVVRPEDLFSVAGRGAWLLMRAALLASLVVFCAGAALAQTPPLAVSPDAQGKPRTLQENIEIGASTNEISIASDFRGADFTMFGALNNADQLLLAIGQYDIVVTLEGPNEYTTVRKKSRVAGIWINTSAITFAPLPESYSMASTRNINDIASPGTLKAMGLGVEHLPLNSAVFSGVPDNVYDFQEAYRRLKLASGIYRNDTTGVRLERTGLFWATLRLPANVPNGVHTARAYLFKSGMPVAQRELKLRVVKTGMEQAITNAAHQTPVVYGVLCVLTAVITGWGASLLFRRD